MNQMHSGHTQTATQGMPELAARTSDPGLTGEVVSSMHTQTEGSAFFHWPSHLRLWLLAFGGLGLDLWSKNWAFSQIDPVKGMDAIPKLLRFERMLNTGALFGLGKGWTPLFIAASFLALGFVLFLFCQSSPRRRSLHVALACVLAGAVGNLYDRAFAIADVVHYTRSGMEQTAVGKITTDNEREIVVNHWPDGPRSATISKEWNPRVSEQGVVRDFLKLRLGPLNIWPWIFNVADILLVVGVALLLLNFHWDRRAEKAEQAAKLENASADTPG